MLKYQAVTLNIILCYISAAADGSSFCLWDLNFAISNLTVQQQQLNSSLSQTPAPTHKHKHKYITNCYLTI